MSIGKMESLTDQEFETMILLLQRYASADMDQFESWKFDSNKGKVFVEISLAPRGPESAYDEVAGSQ